jgi:hypothetical protein
MQIIRFALGIRFAPVAEDDAVLQRLLHEVPKKRFIGMKLYAGHCALDEEDDVRILTVVTMGQGIKKTKALYHSIIKSPALTAMLADHRPIILTNAIARLEGLEYCGEFNKNCELIKAGQPSENDGNSADQQ